MRFFKLLPLLFFGFVNAQEEVVQSVYFEFDKYSLNEEQANAVVDYIQKTDSTRIESIQIFGYCDDRGKEAYNFKLSNNRANAIKEKLTSNCVKNKIIVTIEGKGRVLIDEDIVENLPEVRSKNRRVDVVINLKPLPKIQIPGFFTKIQKKHVIGDHIYLENIYFERGSSVLTYKSKGLLDKLAFLLNKNKTLYFEVQGHVCCTPPYYVDAIDKDTKKRQLSQNRAETVYKYFLFKKIDKKRMTFKGYGSTVPLGKGSEYDRRVELVITKT